MARYVLYNNDQPAANFTYDQGVICRYEPVKPDLLPMQIKETSPDGFTLWIRERAIDLNSLQHRNLVYNLLGSRDKVHLAIATHMLSISDTFTCFEEGTFIPRASLFNETLQNEIGNYILLSGDTSLRKAAFASPNISTDGSFTKTWKYENNAWWLYKVQSKEATQAEVEISKVLQSCGWDTAVYEYDNDSLRRVKSLNFVKNHEFFEPYDSFRFAFPDKSDDDDVIMKNLSSLGKSFRQAWKRILLTDALFYNTDRHVRNFGVIRSSETGQTLRLAPNFDNNQAYLSNPGGKYSSAMLRRYWQSADEEDEKSLKVLLQCCKKNDYLKQAYEAGMQILSL